MNPKSVELQPAAAEGPILSNRAGVETTIWRDGEVVRADRWGRLKFLPPVAPIAEPLFVKEKAA